MKRCLLAALLPVLLLLRPVPAFAASYTDDMTDLNSNHIKTYANLTPYVISQAGLQGGWSRLPDLTMFTFASPARPKATASYVIQGAQSLTVSIYTASGTFVAPVPQSDRYSCGPCQDNLSYLNLQQAFQASYSPSQDAVYASAGGALRKVYDNDYYYECVETDDAPTDLTGYGVNVYASSDGASYSRLNLRIVTAVKVPGVSYVYEQYGAPVPPGTRHILVELVDTTRVLSMTTSHSGAPVLAEYPRRAGLYASLASVAFTGEDLVLGAPAEVSWESDPTQGLTPPQSESSSSKSASSKSERDRASSSTSSASSKASSSKASSSSAPSSKFEGVITSGTAAPSSRSASISGSSSSSAVESPSPSAPAAAAEEPSTVDIHYQVAPAAGQEDSFSKWVVAYIIAVVGAILFVAVRMITRK